jgi:hypothetical protein
LINAELGEKKLEGSSRDVIEELYWHFSGGTEEILKNLRQDSQCPGEDSNSAPPECESSALPLNQLVRSKCPAFDTLVFKLRTRLILQSYGL